MKLALIMMPEYVQDKVNGKRIVALSPIHWADVCALSRDVIPLIAHRGRDVGGAGAADSAEFSTLQHDPCTAGLCGPVPCILPPSQRSTWGPD